MQSEFDDHIKKQVDGFKLTPSPQIWDLVEAQLPEKKRRRFIFWWWPLGVILIGFGVYEFGGNKKNNKLFSYNKTSIKIKKSDVKDSINNLIKIDKITDNKSKLKILNNRVDGYLTKSKISNTEMIVDNPIIKKEIISNNNGNDLNTEKVLKNEVVVDENNQPKKAIVKNEVNSNIKDSFLLNKNLDSQSVKQSIDTTIDNLAKKEIKNTGKDSGLIKEKKAVNKNTAVKFKWEFIADIGSSNTVGKAFGINNNAAYDLSNNLSASPGSGLASANLYSPTAGISFGIGLQKTTQIANRFAWFGGVGYYYLGNHQASGARVDSSKIIGGDSAQFYTGNNNRIDKVDSYYKYGNSLNHDNNLHVLNVSIGLKYNIGKAFSLNGGMGIGYQISSTWLQPDTKQSILYYSDKLTNKWNIGAKFGFDWHFYKIYSIGVFYNYNFSKASLAIVQQNLHWQTVGATFSVQLPFKK